MKSISLDITKAAQFLPEGAVAAYEQQVKAAQEALEIVQKENYKKKQGLVMI